MENQYFQENVSLKKEKWQGKWITNVMGNQFQQNDGVKMKKGKKKRKQKSKKETKLEIVMMKRWSLFKYLPPL